MNQRDIIHSLPAHLQPFVRQQDYTAYTPRDQAAWRFLMRHLAGQLAATAHPVYLEGLRRTGISLQQIPSIDEMNASLASLGWRAVVVDGFIPPAIFMEFQALKVLVIAVAMRDVEHLLYTPAPDILHESAGHAPFIVDIDYAEFLQRFGEVGMKAIANQADLASYEAIRQLSILKENPGSSAQEIAAAEAELAALSSNDTAPSEAALLTRLHWWTVEYGLVGETADYRIFGAGLLSSLGESQSCLDDAAVVKIPLTVDAIRTPYDITRQQPQLFVTRSCKHLSQVLNEFAASMCFTRGGAESLRVAINAGTVCTASYDSGVQVSGVFTEVLCDAVGAAIYLRTEGPTQLSFREQQLHGHGIEYHAQGFGSPIGKLKDFSRCLSEYTIDELRAHNIEIGSRVQLEYLSGITVTGRLERALRQHQRNLVLSFTECSVTTLDGRLLFEPDWGTYDLTVGASITSVYGGAADREALQLYKPSVATAAVAGKPDPQLLAAYQRVTELAGESTKPRAAALAELEAVLDQYPQEWLLRAELLDMATAPLRLRIESELRQLAQQNPALEPLVKLALAN